MLGMESTWSAYLSFYTCHFTLLVSLPKIGTLVHKDEWCLVSDGPFFRIIVKTKQPFNEFLQISITISGWETCLNAHLWYSVFLIECVVLLQILYTPTLHSKHADNITSLQNSTFPLPVLQIIGEHHCDQISDTAELRFVLDRGPGLNDLQLR